MAWTWQSLVGEQNGKLIGTLNTRMLQLTNELNRLDSYERGEHVFNVKHPRFGAAGDGLRDDTAAIQRAIDAAQLVGGTVHVPPGIFHCTSQLHVTDAVSLRGDFGATIRFPTGVTTGEVATTGEGLIDVLDVSGFRMSGVTVTGKDNTLLCFRGCSRIRVTDCDFLMDGTSGESTKCILVGRSPNVEPIFDVQITNNYFEPEAGEPVLVIGYTSLTPDRIVIANNTVNAANVSIASTSGIKVDRFCTNVVIAGNVIDGAGNLSFGITAEQGSNGVYIGGNVVEDVLARGIFVISDAATSDGIGAQAVEVVLIEGNVVRSPDGGGSGSTGILIDAENAACDAIIVKDNLIEGWKQAIRENILDGVTDLMVADNVCLNCTADPVISIKSSDAIVQGNYVNGSAAVRSFGITDASASGVYLRDNIFLQVNGAAAAVQILGSGHFVERNVGTPSFVYENAIPAADATYDLGSLSAMWDGAFVNTLYVDSTLTVGPDAAASGTVKLQNLNAIKWRNGADAADLGLFIDANDVLQSEAEVRTASFYRDGTTAGITASATQSQGQQPLTTGLNQVSVVTNANDVVTLPAAQTGRKVIVANDGANTLQIFPASGDAIEAGGVNNSTTLAAGGRVTYRAYNTTTWIAT